jgi:hypothetical protein
MPFGVHIDLITSMANLEGFFCPPGTPAPPRCTPVVISTKLTSRPTTAISGRGTAKGHAPHCTPKTAVSTPLHAPLSTRLDEISSRRVPQSKPFFGPFGPPGRPRGPLPPSNCAKIAGAGAFPPRRPPRHRCPAPRLGGLRPAPHPPEGGVSRITSDGRRVQLPCSE